MMEDVQQLFFERIGQLNKGEYATLRKNAGMLLDDADGKAISVFYKCLPTYVNSFDESKWFVIACSCCLWEKEVSDKESFELILSELIRREEVSNSIKHRIEVLLDTKWDSDGYMAKKLVRLIKLARQKSENVMPDFNLLLTDLIFWNNDSQSIQRKWARTIFSKNDEKNGKEI